MLGRRQNLGFQDFAAGVCVSLTVIDCWSSRMLASELCGESGWIIRGVRQFCDQSLSVCSENEGKVSSIRVSALLSLILKLQAVVLAIIRG